MRVCKLCDKELNDLSSLQRHLKLKHKLNDHQLEEYYIKYINPNIDDKCPICNYKKKFKNLSVGYLKTCGNRECTAKYVNTYHKERQRRGCIKRNKKWKESGKQKEISLKSSQNRDYKKIGGKISESLNKINENGLKPVQQSMIDKYGVDNPMKVDSIKKQFVGKKRSVETYDKIKNTMIDRYGVSNYTKTDAYKRNQSKLNLDNMIPRIKKFLSEQNLECLSDLETIYSNEKTVLEIKCLSCNNMYRKNWNDIQTYWICRKCNPMNTCSKQELELSEYFDSFGINYQKNAKIIKNPLTDRYWEYDFYFPDKKLAIEFNGLYWHCERNQLVDSFHLDKLSESLNNGIRLIQIFEDEYLYHKDIVLSRLENILGMTRDVIYGRKTKIKEITNSQKNKFLVENHIQGSDISKYYYGLFYQSELVSVMTFATGNISKGSKSVEGVYELNRFCNKIGTTVIGGSSKLLKHFLNSVSVDKIYSYADRRWSNGNLYHKLGFYLVSETKPNYYYVNLSKSVQRWNRFSFRKSALIHENNYSEDKTEHQIMNENGWYRIYDCGNLKFEMRV